ncbi:MAG: hypothetical protein KIT84_00485 [Labilithrix sp.]|nr:hypothetical protein [Labilithrix sp.]MCW5809460.1 hypothetical protein [Labilithrix sp.]
MATNKTNDSDNVLPADLIAKRDEIALLLTKARLDDAETNYRVGVAVYAVMRDPERYGKRGVAKIAAAVPCTAALLYSYAKVAATWDEESFGALINRKDSKGQSFSFSHLIALAGVSDAQKRELLIDEALAKAWSVRDLARKCRGARARRGSTALAFGDILGAITSSTTAAVERAVRDLEALAKVAASGRPPPENTESVQLLMENCRAAKARFSELEELATRLLSTPLQEAAE